MTAGPWTALVLAAGRGADDPMARAFSVSHKCLLPVAGQPMLARVIESLRAVDAIGRRIIVIEPEVVLPPDIAGEPRIPPLASAAQSVLGALAGGGASYPLLVTTGDHPLLTAEMIRHFLTEVRGDLSVALARDSVILGRYPEAKRTFLRFGGDRVSGCNLFAFTGPKALPALETWQSLDRVRKQPWRLVAAFGAGALLRFAAGQLTLESAFAIASRRLGLDAHPVLMPFAEAAIDVDKPADHALAEAIFKSRDPAR